MEPVLFTRGETQILIFCNPRHTLGEAQELDNLSPIKTKRYMHHYNFPPFSTGEASLFVDRAGARLGMERWQNAHLNLSSLRRILPVHDPRRV
jgi:hypothetical protein